MTIIDLLRWLCKTLNENKIDYFLSGSFAMSSYATPRGSNDIDIVINISNEEIDKFLSLFAEDDFHVHKRIVIEEVEKKGMFNFISLKYGYKIDFVVKKNTSFSKSEFSRKQFRNVYDFDAWVVSIEDLILSKLMWTQQLESSKQLQDIEFLLLDTNPDLEYIRNWCKMLNLKTYNLEI
jgi:hypothetical protein